MFCLHISIPNVYLHLWLVSIPDGRSGVQHARAQSLAIQLTTFPVVDISSKSVL